MGILNESLRLIEGLSYHEYDDHTLLSIPRSAKKPFISFKNNNGF